MEGEYHFKWQAVAGSGIIEGQYKQTIYGESLTDAVSKFEKFHGPLSPDDNGVCIVITCVSWAPAY
jgi:hypothetical protein